MHLEVPVGGVSGSKPRESRGNRRRKQREEAAEGNRPTELGAEDVGNRFFQRCLVQNQPRGTAQRRARRESVYEAIRARTPEQGELTIQRMW